MKVAAQRQGQLFMKAKEKEQIIRYDPSSLIQCCDIARSRFLPVLLLSTLVFGISEVTFASAYNLLHILDCLKVRK